MLTKKISTLKQKLKNEEGLSVVELMIGTIILLTVAAVVATVIVTTSGQISQTAEDAYYKNQITLAGKIVAKTIGESKSLIAFSTNSIELETQDDGTVEIFAAGVTCSLTAKIYDKNSLLINEINIFDTLDSCAVFTNNDPIFEIDLNYTRGEKTFTTTIEAAINNSRETKDSGILTDESITSLLAYTASFNNGQPYIFDLNTPNEQTPEIQVSGSAPFTYSLHSGALPEVLTFNETNGRITGPNTWNLSDETNLFNTALTIKIEDSAGIQILLPIILQSPIIKPIQATGGIITEHSENGLTYRIHTFTGVGSTPFNVTDVGNMGGEIEYLIVAGGGAGGGVGSVGGGGGGGAGGILFGTHNISPGIFSATVGAGGAGAVNSTGGNGENSSIFGFTAIGGGGGGGINVNGQSGGSGGGGGAHSSGAPRIGGSTTSNQGTDGGSGSGTNTTGQRAGGGGGGASTAGSNATPGEAGNGGEGVLLDISGEETFYAGGGGGGVADGSDKVSSGSAGAGGGGDGRTGNGLDAATNTGGGGGGGGGNGAAVSGGNGGSGIIIVRYIIDINISPPASTP